MRTRIVRIASALGVIVACTEPGGPAGEPPGEPSNGSPSPPRDPWGPDQPTSGPDPSTDPGTTGTTTAAPTTTGTTAANTTETGTEAGPEPGTTTPEGCGDGVVQAPAEECDEGYENNVNSGSCTQQCQSAICGDGFVWEGIELCDRGPENSPTTYDGCTEACTPGPRCGDDIVQPEEECDGNNLEGSAPCQPLTCKLNARLAFVTSTRFQGSFGGLAQADELCEAAATAGGFDSPMKFKAWLSDGSVTAAQRLPAAAADPHYPYALRSGKLLADDLDDLITNGPRVPLDIDEFGETLTPEEPAWTNVHLGGFPYSTVNHCMDWTSASFLDVARTGLVSPATAEDLPAWQMEFLWTSNKDQPCSYTARLYCLED